MAAKAVRRLIMVGSVGSLRVAMERTLGAGLHGRKRVAMKCWKGGMDCGETRWVGGLIAGAMAFLDVPGRLRFFAWRALLPGPAPAGG